jgi:HD-like signal output (HDOD) protein
MQNMPAGWLGLLIIAVLAIPAWRLARRGRRSGVLPTSATGAAGSLDGRVAVDGAAGKPGGGASLESGADAAASSSQALSGAEIFRRLHEFAFGVPTLGLPSLAAYDAIAPGAIAVLETVATEPRYAPRRPLLLPQLLQAMRDDEVTRGQLAKIIARDPALAGSLLRLANSPFYRVTEKPAESIDRAVALLGTNGIRSLVATALVQPVFRLSKQEFPTFPETVWEHTMRVATAAEAHAAIVEDSDPFAAQLLGLTMGLGSIVVFRVALDRYASVGTPPEAAVIAALLDAQAGPVASRIAASWELSARISTALEDQAPAARMREPSSLGRSLYFGRLMGALSVLRANDRITDETAKASILETGATAFQFDSIWMRLTGRAPQRERR